jgi:hypothetical protein
VVAWAMFLAMDGDLGELERAWTASGDPHDQLVWLQARVRQGTRVRDLEPEEGALVLEARLAAEEIDEDSLHVAAHAGLAAAREALYLPSEPIGIGWSAGFARFGARPAARVTSALSRVAVTRLGALTASDVPRDLLDAVEAWADSPGSASACEGVSKVAVELQTAWDEGEIEIDQEGIGDEWEAKQEFELLLRTLCWFVDLPDAEPADAPGELEEALVESIPFEKLTEIVAYELIGWALQPKAQSRAAVVARPYSPKSRYVEGDSIEHVKFGVGKVERVTRSWVEAVFECGTRRLAHGLASA